MRIIGVTGPTGAGKSSVLDYLAEKGCYIVNADEVYHELLETDDNLMQEIKMRFPSVFDGAVFDRKSLGRLVFSDLMAKDDLESITHPGVTRRVTELLDAARENGVQLAAIEAIALIESGAYLLCDKILVVSASTQQRVNRITARDDVTIRYAAARMSSQRELSFYLESSDFHIENNGNIAELHAKIDTILKKMQEE